MAVTLLHHYKSVICQVSLLKILAGHGDSVGRPSHDQWVVPMLRYDQDEVQHVNCKMLSMKRTSIPTNKICGSASSRHRSLSRWKAKSIWLLLDCWQWKPYLLYVDSHRTAARLPHLFLSSTHLHVIWFAADFSCSIISQTLSSTPILSCSTQDNASWLQQDMAAFCFLKSEVHRGQRYEYCLRSRDIQCWSTSPERRDTNSNSASFFQNTWKNITYDTTTLRQPCLLHTPVMIIIHRFCPKKAYILFVTKEKALCCQGDTTLGSMWFTAAELFTW